MVSAILNTKICLPPVRSNLVVRSRLLQRLDESLVHPLTLISAPAGFGKSTLFCQWVHSDKAGPDLIAHTAWLSLDEEDDEPARFWEYVLAALEMVQENDLRFEAAHILLQGLPSASIHPFLINLINQISRVDTDRLLVLDDFQFIHYPAILEGITFLVEHLPPQLHIFLLSRSDPSLPLGRWRIRGWLNEIRTADLRFTFAEASGYFHQFQNLDLSEQNILMLEERTEGWIAGLQMAGLSLRDRNPNAVSTFIAEFTGRYHMILDYLTDEVLLSQPEEIQDILLKTSILSRLCPSLCASVVYGPSSQEDRLSQEGRFVRLLEQLEHANLFIIPLDDHRTWYRFHHLFAELLRARLIEQHPEWIADLHRQAASWYEANEFPFEAMQHALSVEDLSLATDVIERIVRKPATWATGNIARMLEIVNMLPPEIIDTHPWLRINLSGFVFVGGQPTLADQMLADVEAGLSSFHQPVPEELVMYIDIYRAFYAATLGDFLTAEHRAERGLSKLKDDDRRLYGHILATLAQAAFTQGNVDRAAQLYRRAVDHQKRNKAHFTAITWSSNLVDVLTVQGHLREAERTCQETIDYESQKGRPGAAVSYTQTFLAAIYYEWNRLEEAEVLLRNGLHLMQTYGISPNFGRAYAMLAWIQQAQEKPADALDSIEIAQQLAQRSQSRRYIDNVSAYQARLWLLQGDKVRACRWAEQWVNVRNEQTENQPASAYLVEFEDLTAALILYAVNHLTEADTILTPILQSAEQAGRNGILIEALAIHSLIQKELSGRISAAHQTLLRALRLSEPEQYLRVYINLSIPMADLLNSLPCPDQSIQIYRDSLMSLIQPSAATHPVLAVNQPAALVDKLTNRELEILHLISVGMSNQQIAKKLYLTLNTIRAHSTHIFTKLDVHNRTEAVARARDLGLLK